MRAVHLAERGLLHQRASVLAGVDDLFYQAFLETDGEEVACEVGRQETSVRERKDAYVFALVDGSLGREAAAAPLLQEVFHEAVVSCPQATVEHLVEWRLGFVEADEQFVHFPAQAVGQSFYKVLEVVAQSSEQARYVQVVAILAGVHRVDVIKQPGHVVCFEDGHGIAGHQGVEVEVFPFLGHVHPPERVYTKART